MLGADSLLTMVYSFVESLFSVGDAWVNDSASQPLTLIGGRIIFTPVTGPVVLAPGDNPLIIASTGTVTSTGAGADGVDGPIGTTWTIVNSGKVTSAAAVGISLAGAGIVTNAGSISGKTGIILRDGGSVSNTANGSISASGAIGGGFAVGADIYITGATGTVTNDGALSGGAYGVAMAGGGSVTNSGLITGGEDGVVFGVLPGTLLNKEKIIATVDDGVGFFNGGTVTNAVGALISGAGTGGAGIFISGGLGQVSNSGTVTTSGSRFGIFMNGGGSVTNLASGFISGPFEAIEFNGFATTLTNAGTVTSTGPVVVDVEAGGSINNQSGGTISGGTGAIFMTGGAGTVTNAGSISGTSGSAIDIAAGGNVTNAAGGSISGGSNGIEFTNETAGTLSNSGMISASLSGSTGAYLTGGGTVANSTGGSISGNGFGIFVAGADGVVTNSGSISGALGIELGAGGSLSNTMSGKIVGQVAGLFTTGAAATLTNDGSISATASGGAALDIEAGGSITNDASASIAGTSFGIFLTGGAGSVINSGSINASSNLGIKLSAGGSVTNTANAVISGAASGIYVYGSGTVTNAGTITGTNHAVAFFSAGNDRVVIDPGAVFNGGVIGNTTGMNTLELAAGRSSINLTSGFTNFGTVEVDTDSDWTVSNANTAVTDLFQLDNTSTFDVATALGVSAQISFATDSDLDIANTANFGIGAGTTAYAGPLLESFGGTDAIDLTNFSATGATATFSSTTGLLQLNNGTQVATLSFQDSSLGSGAFHVASDHATGALLTIS